MSSVHATASTRSLVIRNTIGTLLAGAGTALVLYGARMDDTRHGQAPVSVGAGVLLIGVFVLTPLLSRPLIAAAAPFMRIFGVSGKLARQNSVRNPRRTAATASALMIGLTLITGLTVIAGSVQQAINKMATDALKADYTVSMANQTPISAEVEKKLAADDHVEALSPLRNSPARIGRFHRVPDRRQGRGHRRSDRSALQLRRLGRAVRRQGRRGQGHRQEQGLEGRFDLPGDLRGRQEEPADRLGRLRGQRDDQGHHAGHRHPGPAHEAASRACR